MHESNETATEPFGDLVRDALKSIGEEDVVPLAPAPLPTVGTTVPTSPFRVLARLAGGELIEAGSFASQAEARARGEELAAELAGANGRWPWIGTGFVRPELVVAVQVEPVGHA